MNNLAVTIKLQIGVDISTQKAPRRFRSLGGLFLAYCRLLCFFMSWLFWELSFFSNKATTIPERIPDIVPTTNDANKEINISTPPLVLDLQEHFYSFKLSELAKINGKYALIMLKLWESPRRGTEKYTTISTDLESWQSWFLGKDNRMPAGQFFQKVIVRSVEELEEKLQCEFFITTQKRGRKVVGYEIMITDTSAWLFSFII